MIPVADALERILDQATSVSSEKISLFNALGRVLASEVQAESSHPPFAAAAMDGFALKKQDIQSLPVSLPIVSHIPAGVTTPAPLPSKAAARIFTGAPIPAGADIVVMQENTTRLDKQTVQINPPAQNKNYIRPAGMDFQKGTPLLRQGHRLTAQDIGLLAAMNVATVSVYRRARVAILASGDEIVMPGEALRLGQIPDSNSFLLAAMVKMVGAVPVFLGIAKDNASAIDALLQQCQAVDLIVSLGGASVGTHDYMRTRLTALGGEIDFWKIAMRPGKPLIHGKFHNIPYLGLPGNPVSCGVCGLLFAQPFLRKLMGETNIYPPLYQGILTSNLGQNDARQDYLRARITPHKDGQDHITPFAVQDSALISKLAQANALLVRPPHDPALTAGATVNFHRIPNNFVQ